jgi:hypothetical protein
MIMPKRQLSRLISPRVRAHVCACSRITSSGICVPAPQHRYPHVRRPEQASRRKVVRIGNAHECLEYVAKRGGDLPLLCRVGSRKIFDNQRMAPVVIRDAVPSYVPRLQCRPVVASDDPKSRSD